MSWKDRITPISDTISELNPEVKSWRDRIAPISDATREQTSNEEAALVGAADAASLGFSDELAGVAGSLTEKAIGLIPGVETPTELDARLASEGFTGDIKPDRSLEDLYREYRDSARKNLEQAEETNPLAYYSGVAGGSLLPGFGTARAVTKGASLAQKALAGAKAGTTVGAVTGLGTSEADLTKGELGEAAIDSAIGAGTGAALGGALPYGVELGKRTGRGAVNVAKDVGKKTSDILDNYEWTSDLLRSTGLGLKGESILGKEAAKQLSGNINIKGKELQKLVTDTLTEKFDKKLEILKKSKDKINYSELYNEAVDDINKGVKSFKLNPDEERILLDQLNRRFYDKLPQKVKNALKETTTEVIDPKTGKILTKTTAVQDKIEGQVFIDPITRETKEVIVSQTPSSDSSKIKKLVNKLTKSTDVTLPGTMKGDMRLEDAANFVRDLQQAAFLKKGQTPGISSIMKDTARKASDRLVEKAPTTSPLNDSSSFLYKALDRIGVDADKLNSGELDPNFVKFIKRLDNSHLEPEDLLQKDEVVKYLQGAFGKDQAQTLIKNLQDVSRDYLLGKRTRQSRGGLNWMSQAFGALKDASVSGANVTGRAVKVASSSVNKMYNMTNDMLNDMSNKISTKDPRLGEMLNKAVNSKSETAKNAILFSIIQNPNYRKSLKETFGLEDENE